MKVLCVQCMKLNELPDTPSGEDGRVRFPCPNCGFVTVVTRKSRKAVPAPVRQSLTGNPEDDRPTTPDGRKLPATSAGREVRRPADSKSLHDELFDGSEKQVGDWMVRRLDGTEAGPLTFENLKQMIRDGDIGKIDEVRRLDERYVPAAFHELTAELFNELDMAGVGGSSRKS